MRRIKVPMNRSYARTGSLVRMLRAAGRLLLCLALVLLPVAGASAAHFETGISASHGHGGHADDPTPGDQAPLCHQLGACHAFMAPAAPSVVHVRIAPPIVIAATRLPANAAVHRLFRPPIALARA